MTATPPPVGIIVGFPAILRQGDTQITVQIEGFARTPDGVTYSVFVPSSLEPDVETARAALKQRLRNLSNRELDDEIHRLITEGKEDTPEFHAAFTEDEHRNG